MTDTGEEVSNKEIKQIIQEVIDAEDKRAPIADGELTELLKERGYIIARRTVAKYRDQLNIPVNVFVVQFFKSVCTQILKQKIYGT